MKVKDFFKAVDGARNLCEDLMDHEVEVRVISREGNIMPDHFDLEHCGYMFTPWLKHEDGTLGSLIMTFKVN